MLRSGPNLGKLLCAFVFLAIEWGYCVVSLEGAKLLGEPSHTPLGSNSLGFCGA